MKYINLFAQIDSDIIRKGHNVFVQPETGGFYGATVVYVGKTHYRLSSYYNTGLGTHNVPKGIVWLQDRQN